MKLWTLFASRTGTCQQFMSCAFTTSLNDAVYLLWVNEHITGLCHSRDELLTCSLSLWVLLMLEGAADVLFLFLTSVIPWIIEVTGHVIRLQWWMEKGTFVYFSLILLSSSISNNDVILIVTRSHTFIIIHTNAAGILALLSSPTLHAGHLWVTRG